MHKNSQPTLDMANLYRPWLEHFNSEILGFDNELVSPTIAQLSKAALQ